MIIYTSEKEWKNSALNWTETWGLCWSWCKASRLDLPILKGDLRSQKSLPHHILHILLSLFCMYKLHLARNVMFFCCCFLQHTWLICIFFSIPQMENWMVMGKEKRQDPCYLLPKCVNASELVVNCLYCFSNTHVHLTEHLHIPDTKTSINKAGRKKERNSRAGGEKSRGSVRNPRISFLSIQCKDSRYGNTAVLL